MNLHTMMTFCIDPPGRKSVTWKSALSLAFLCSFNISLAQKSLQYTNTTYEPQIKTVLCYAIPSTNGAPSPAAPFKAQRILMEFDDLREERNNYYVRLIHCNYDWSKSRMRDLEILRDYNEFPITDYSFSINTDVPYVHYRFPLPVVKISGNYLVVVYRDGNKNDLVLTQRILIFDSQITLLQNDNLSGLGNLKSTNQALQFQLNYGRIELINPSNSIHVIIRQNQRWDNAMKDVRPNFIREDLRQLEYRFFDMDNTFPAGNEFRFVDFRSLNSPGQYTEKIDRSRKPNELYVEVDKPRNFQAYSQLPDRNGGFTIENLDTRQEPWISSNYLYVNFSLKTTFLQQDVYVLGAFNGWDLNNENKLSYADGAFNKRILLKQGSYDYQYWVKASSKAEGNQLEGNHFQTENLYDVLVYYRPFQPNADLLVGYFLLPVNPR